MSLVEVARKELRRRHAPVVAAFCLAALGVVGAAALLPRSWTADAVIAIDPKAEDVDVLTERLRAAYAGAALHEAEEVRVETVDGGLRVRYAAPDAERAYGSLVALIATVERRELEGLRATMRRSEEMLEAQARESAAALAQATASLDAARRALPEGGESAVGARIGQLQAELDSLARELRDARKLSATLAERRSALQQQVAEAQAAIAAGGAAAGVAQRRLQGELLPQRAGLDARLESLQEDLRLREARQREVGRLLAQAREQSTAAATGSVSVRELQRAYEDAAALDRQLRLRLQSVRDDIALRATAGALAFEVSRAPRLPPRPDGLAAWVVLATAAAAGVLAAGVLLLGAVLVDDRIRLARTIVVDAELPVLAQVPQIHAARPAGSVRWRAMLLVSLVLVTALAMAAFQVVFG